MPWSAADTAALYVPPRRAVRRRPPAAAARRTGGGQSAALRGRWQLDARGLYRVFGEAEYRFYRSNSGPPAESDSPYATASTLPDTPVDTFADGTWWISVSWFNGVLDSGFLPLSADGATAIRLEIDGGAEVANPPAGPLLWRIAEIGGGVVRVSAAYWQSDALRADSWAIAYTTDGGDPPADDPDAAPAMPTAGLAVLQYDLPAQAAATEVRVRLQTVRGSIYSGDSTIQSLTVEAAGPAAPLGIF